MCYHIFAFIAGFVLDLLIGDPHFIPHPVRLIGSLISFLDKRLNCDAGYNTVSYTHLTLQTIYSV